MNIMLHQNGTFLHLAVVLALSFKLRVFECRKLSLFKGGRGCGLSIPITRLDQVPPSGVVPDCAWITYFQSKQDRKEEHQAILEQILEGKFFQNCDFWEFVGGFIISRFLIAEARFFPKPTIS